MKFICSDESLNSYGFWVMTSGISLERFLKNPVMLWSHSRSYGSRNDVLPIGYWKDVRVENGQLVAEAVFDKKDDFAATIAAKVEQGVLRSCSIGIRILTTSTEAEYLKPGQTRETVVACELKEISICDIPSNGNAVAIALYDEHDRLLSLSDGVAKSVLPELLTNNTNEMKEILKVLGLADNASETLAVAEVRKLHERIAQLEKEKKDAQEASLKEIIDQAVKDCKLAENKRETFMEIGRRNGIEALRDVLDSMVQPMVKPSELINRRSELHDKGWADLSEKEKEDLRSSDPERYGLLFEKEYGFKPEID